MRALLRLVALLIYVGAGYLIGSMVGRLALIPVAAVAHVSHGLQTGLSVAAGLLGIFSAVGYWRAKFGDFQVGSGVHGSARFAGAEEVRRSLGSAAGLIVGRENRKGGQLLRYAGQAHLLTIAPTRSGKGVGAPSSPTC
jgi:type IV secretion system protein VirD4